ncbi:hypothetical protein ACWEN6_13945 [Sphaerisporangium sp. NPDC004334]
MTEHAQASRIATIRKAPSVHIDGGAEMGFYTIEYTVDGTSAGGSVALPHDLESWRNDLTEDGWTVMEADESS